MNTLNVMYQYIFEFRQIRIATTQINLTIKHIFLLYQPLSTTQNLLPARTHNPIYQPQKTISFLNKGIPSFGI